MILLIGGVLSIAISTNFLRNADAAGPLSRDKPQNPAHREARRPGIEDSRTNSKELKTLKNAWAETGSTLQTTAIITPDVRLLAQQTVSELGCTRELISLIDFLDDRNLTLAKAEVEKAAVEIFEGPDGDAARAQLIHLTKTGTAYIANHVEHWSRAAGHHCSEEEFPAFYATLNRHSRPAAQEALFGANERLAEKIPVAAITSTLEALSSGVSSHSRFRSLRSVVSNIPDDADFAQIANLFPDAASKESATSPVRVGRQELFRKWAASDPATAINYLISSREGADAELVTSVAEVVIRKDPSSGVDWIQTFPTGEYFDAAAEAAIYHIGDAYPAEALELAALITDPKLRESCIRIIHAKQARNPR